MSKKGNPIMSVNNHLGGQSIDDMMGSPSTFDRSRNIDIHNKLRCITLARAYQETAVTDTSPYTSFCSLLGKLIRCVTVGSSCKVYDRLDNTTFNEGTLRATIAGIGNVYSTCVFNGKVFIIGDTKIFEYNPDTYAYVDRTPAGRASTGWSIIPTLNFHESGILVGKGSNLYWYDFVLTTRSVIRSFSQGNIVGILEYFEQIGIVVNHNGYDSRVYILGGNFDVDDIGVLGRIPLPGISVQSTAQMGNQVFLIAQDVSDKYVTYMYELQGSTPVLLKSSRYTNGQNEVDFIGSDRVSVAARKRDSPPSDGKYIYIPCRDGVYRYGSPSPFIQTAFTQIACIFDGGGNYSFGQPVGYTIHGNYLIVVGASGGSKIFRWYIGDEPSLKKYAVKGDIKYRTYYSDGIATRKQNVRIVIGYRLPAPLANNSQIKVYIAVNGSGTYTLIDTISTTTLPDSGGQSKMTHVTEANAMPRDWNTIDVKVELIRGSGDTYSPEFYEMYLEHSPILRNAL